MSQSRQSKTTASARVSVSPNADTLVETYAEDLMDEIFGDVDRILAGEDDAIYAETLAQESAASVATVFQAESVTVPAMIVPVSAEQVVRSDASITEPQAIGEVQKGETETDVKDNSQRRPWRKLILGALCLSSLAVAGIWLMRQQQLLPSASTTTAPVTASTEAPTASEEVAFGEYLQRSLRIISGERAAQTESQSPSVVATAPAQTSQPANRPGVIERVFVPLLQPGARTAQTPVAATTPSLPAPNTSSTDTQSSGVSTVPNIAATNTYELVGVLELGDRSAALFEVNGTSQRIYIGETIGSSGWSIVSIENEEVVVRRNGEVRSIYIGQQF
ncbi:MAG: hypothetical protein AAF959_03615 [Cyanobacteria bacterium P01_D01_bin.56]